MIHKCSHGRVYPCSQCAEALESKISVLQALVDEMKQWPKCEGHEMPKESELIKLLDEAIEHIGNMLSYTKHTDDLADQYHIEKQRAIDFVYKNRTKIQEARREG